jgi:hypothetical protein
MVVAIEGATLLARESLLWLIDKLVMAPLCYNNFENEVHQQGDTIKIRKPATYTANEFDAVNGSNVQDANQTSTTFTAAKHIESSVRIPDAEVTKHSVRSLMQEHLGPAAYAVARMLEGDIQATGAKAVTNNLDILGATNTYLTPDLIVDLRKRLAVKNCPVDDSANMHLVMSYNDEGYLLKQEKFTSADYVGPEAGRAIINASMGNRYGFNLYQTNTVHKTDVTDPTGAVDNAANYAIGATSIIVDGFSASLPEGTIITFAGHTTKYTVGANSTSTLLNITPALTAAVNDDEVITALEHYHDLAFHRNAIALAVRPLDDSISQIQGNTGSVIRTVSFGGYSLRLEIWREHRMAQTCFRLDTLYGVEVLEENLIAKCITSLT